MSKKRKRDLNEKLRAREEKIITKSETDDVLDYKRKTGDDYRDKVVKEENRFQDKIHEKISKRTDITSEIETSNKSKNAIKRNIRSNSFQAEVAKSDYQTEVKENRIYDPLAKDQDGDGVIDRYDNDFRDSDVSYEPLGNKKSKLHEKQKRSLKRKNYSDKLFTRKEMDKKKEDN